MLMDKVVEEGRRFAAVSDLKISDMSSQAPVGTTLAVLERVLKVMSAVQARVYYAMKQEFKLLAAIIRDNTPDEYSYEPEVGSKKAKKSDYDNVDVIPVSDPNAATMSQKIVQYQAVLQLSQTNPQIYDMPYLHRQMIETLGIKNAAKIIPMPDDQKPIDPVTENMNLLMGKPVKAFIEQDHEAHLQVHMAAMQDPKIMQVVGQNPQAQAIMAAGAAHVMEHVAFQYRKEIEKQLGANLPPYTEDDEDRPEIKPEVAAQIAQLAAAAAGQLLQKDQAEAQAQKIAQQQQDPLVQMQQMELQLRAKELELKAQKMQQDMQLEAQKMQQSSQTQAQKMAIDAAIKADEIKLREMEIRSRQELEGAKLGVDVAKEKRLTEQKIREASERMELEGAKLGASIARDRAMAEQDRQRPPKGKGK
jgi:hypothetical protein